MPSEYQKYREAVYPLRPPSPPAVVTPGSGTGADNRLMASDRSGWGAAGGRPRRGLGAAAVLRHSLLWASRWPGVQRVVSGSPLTRRLVRRFVAGEGLGDVVLVARRLIGRGLSISVDHLGEDTRDAADARAAVAAHRALIARLASRSE